MRDCFCLDSGDIVDGWRLDIMKDVLDTEFLVIISFGSYERHA